MALIKCPECGGNVSDKAYSCIHCGYPISNLSANNKVNDEIYENTECIIEGKKYNLVSVLESIRKNDDNTAEQILKSTIPNLTFRDQCNLVIIMRSTDKIPKEFNSQIGKETVSKLLNQMMINEKREKLRKKGINPDAPAACPKCGSTQFSTLQRGHSLIFGWLGSGEPQNVCQKCGYKWTPGRR